MRKITSLLIATIIIMSGTNALAQDIAAKSILDKLSNKAKTYSSLSAEFTYKMVNTSDGIDESQTGFLMTKGEKYRFSIAGQTIISDGKLVWTVLEDAEEVQINEVPQDEETEDYINPVSVLTLWEKGFKYKYDSKVEKDSKVYDIINLYPENADEVSFHTVKLMVDQAALEVKEVLLKGKDGTDFTYTLTSFSPNKPIDDGKFTFDTEKHSDFDVIDLR